MFDVTQDPKIKAWFEKCGAIADGIKADTTGAAVIARAEQATLACIAELQACAEAIMPVLVREARKVIDLSDIIRLVF